MKDARVVVQETAGRDPHQGRFGAVWAEDLDAPEAKAASAFLLHQDGSGSPLETLKRIRRHRLPAIYLKPVVLLTGRESDAKELADLVDAVWDIDLSEEVPPGVQGDVDAIRRRSETLGITGPEGDSDLSFRILRFLATRASTFSPVATIQAASGFRYPPLEPFLGDGPAENDVGELLHLLEEQRLLAGSFVTKSYACTHCRCAFLSFLEVCPDCGTADLRVDDMVHHFRCGHVAPLRDYVRQGGLICPKCDREMRQIGVDYDKPSLIYDCNECQNRFPEPTITTVCYRCHRVTPPEVQILRTMKSYEVTAFGENAAAHGLDSLFVRILQKRVKLFDYAVMKDLVAAEAYRTARYERSESTLLVLSFQGMENVYIELGSRVREVFEELTVAFRGILRESDLLSARNESLFLALLAETSPHQAQRAVERLQEAVGTLLQLNVRNPPRLSFAILPLHEGLDVDQAVADLLAGWAKEAIESGQPGVS